MSARRTSGLVAGKVLGTTVIVQPTTLVMIALLTYVFAFQAGSITARSLLIGLFFALTLFTSAFLHEVAHALAARVSGRKESEIVVTLWGGHTSFDDRSITPLVSALIALAGPAMNLVIAGAATLVINLASVGELTGRVLAYVAWSNTVLAVFNALPGFPMDGGRVLESIVWRVTGSPNKGTLYAAWVGRVFAVALVVYVLGSPFLYGRRPDLLSVIGTLIVFSILWPAASSAIRRSQVILRREGLTVAALMIPAVGVHYSATVAGARHAAEAVRVSEIVVIGADDVPAGRFPFELTDEVPPPAREFTSLQAVTTPIPRGAAIEVAAKADILIPELREWWGKTDVLVVVEGTTVVGILKLADVVAALS